MLKELRHQGIGEDDEEAMEGLYKEMVHKFSDPTIRKFCEVLFERTKVLCSFYSGRDSITGKDSPNKKELLPSMDNVLNFNFEVLFRYEGEKLLESLSKEDRIKAQHLLAGTLLLYLGGSGKGPMGSYGSWIWQKQDLETIVKSGLLTEEEIQPLLDACELENLHHYDPPREDDSAVFLCEDKLTDEQKRKITISAYRRFYLADHEDYDKVFADAVPAKLGELDGKEVIMIVKETCPVCEAYNPTSSFKESKPCRKCHTTLDPSYLG